MVLPNRLQGVATLDIATVDATEWPMMWVLRETVEFSINAVGGNNLDFRMEVFESRPEPGAPRFRLRVWRHESFTLKVFGSEDPKEQADHSFLVQDYLFDKLIVDAKTPEDAIAFCIEKIQEQCAR